GDAEKAQVAGLERLHVGSVRLHRFARGVDLVVERDHRTVASRAGVDADASRVEQVPRTVEIAFARVPLRANEDDWFWRIDGEVEEPGRLLEGIGAVRNDHAGNLRARERLRHRSAQLNRAVWIHVIAGHVGQVRHRDARDLRAFGTGLDQ